jgi:broad specificity phosphatase PhoE
MRRCKESLEILGLNRTWQIDSRLREIDFGNWEGKTFSEVSKKDPEIVTTWTSQPETFCFPNGESLTDFYFRVREFSQFINMNRHSRLLIISHGGVIRHLICNFLGLPNSNYLLFDVQYAKYASLRIYSEGGILTGLNIGG